MNEKSNRRKPEATVNTPPERVSQPQSQPVTPAPQSLEEVPYQRRCPLCWGTMRGVGREFSRFPQKSRKYVKCDKCGHSWSFDSEWIEHVTRVNHRIPEDLSKRDEGKSG